MTPRSGGGPRGGQRLVVAIDAGGTKLAGGLVDPATGAVTHREVVPTRAERGGAAVLGTAVALAARLRHAALAEGDEVVGAGIGVPELVDPAGEIRTGDVIGWAGLPVRDSIAAAVPGVPVRVTADVRAAALAEACRGAGAGHRLVAYVTIGTGISSTLVIDGVPLAGARGNALVLASGPTTVLDPATGTLHAVVVEDVASGAGLAARYAAATGRAVDGARAVLAAAQDGDAVGLDVVRTGATVLGSAIGQLLNVTDPDVLVLGGGLGSATGPYRDALVPAIRAHTWSPETRELPILSAAFGPDSGLVGAGLAGAEPDP